MHLFTLLRTKLLIFFTFCCGCPLTSQLCISHIELLFFCTISFFIIGFVDDYLSIANKKNTGLKSNEKFTLQALIAVLFIIFANQSNYINPLITISNNWNIDTNIVINTNKTVNENPVFTKIFTDLILYK